MGVSGLWTLVGPAARPVQLESLRNQKMAVDASIWIHQFMRTMRDKEGNALRNGHLLGFFRRLCKLLFYNIKPVFVFDGGAPALKRSTIKERRRRREGLSNNLKRTAEKILSAQVKSRVLADEEKRRRGEPEEQDENYVYFDEAEKAAALENIRQKMKRDQYELPPMPAQKSNLDPRLATEQELIDFINEYRPSKEDIDSEAFLALPPEIQFEIVRDLGMESRKTSWARLDEMVRQSRTALDFSKQQIKLLMHRNDMTQRLLNINERPADARVPTRIAGERSREYVLVKNEDVTEGLGWKLPGMVQEERESELPAVVDPEPLPASEPEDKVKNAIAGNPKLAAMFAKFDSDEEFMSDEEDGQLDYSEDDDDEPLFLQPTTRRQSSLVDNMQAYVEDDEEAVNEVIRRIYANEEAEGDDILEEEPQSLSPSPAPVDLDENSMYHLWLSRVPDSFLYLHSINDEYKRMLHDTVFEHDIEHLESHLKRVEKVYGKTSDRNEMELESLSFQARFISDILQWKRWKGCQQSSPRAEESKVQPTDQQHIPLSVPALVNAVEQSKDEIAIQKEASDTSMIEKSFEKDTATAAWSPAPGDFIMDEEDEIDIPLMESNDANIQKQQSPETMSIQESEEQPSGENDDQSSKERDDRPPTQNDDQQSKEYDVHASTENGIHISIENDEQSPQDMSRSQEELEQDMKAAQELLEMDHGYNSDEELMGDVRAEESEYARFVSDIANKDIESVREELYRDMKELNKQQRKDMGNADDVTNQMVQDIQEMLRLFGIPYVISPMEAEAQCAELARLSLVEGVVTDDSDVFLFGGNRIYKNMFNQQKYVECYLMQDLEREMRLDRGKLVQLAFLLGSDYTDGIPGIGPVAAIEILAEFTRDEDKTIAAPLERFRKWYEGNHDENDFQRKFRKKHKNLDIPQDFPSPLVIEAYYQPMVDASQEQFEWGAPQLDLLRQFLMESFTWSEKKADEVLLPVIREMNKRKTEGQQTNIGTFFNMPADNNTVPHKRKAHKSKRVQSAINRWRGEDTDDSPKETRKKTRRA
ncbi:hypothetical protein BJV82DRAFT_627178 [Fennellomyces sp. T-0311]|nr:hypothetical protein BJV82DRAFT_627178 [Fennellomyces sp. T-0311]